MTSTCSVCAASLPADGLTRKRHRSRKCKTCNNQAALDRRRSDPIARLQHKLCNNLKKHWPTAQANLWSRETIEYVLEKWDKKCAITGETNFINLCIVPAVKHTLPPTRDQLVLLTIHEAMSLSRNDNVKRLAKFSDEARGKLEIS